MQAKQNILKGQKKKTGKKDNFARSSRFFVHFFAVATRLQRESA